MLGIVVGKDTKELIVTRVGRKPMVHLSKGS